MTQIMLAAARTVRAAPRCAGLGSNRVGLCERVGPSYQPRPPSGAESRQGDCLGPAVDRGELLRRHAADAARFESLHARIWAAAHPARRRAIERFCTTDWPAYVRAFDPQASPSDPRLQPLRLQLLALEVLREVCWPPAKPESVSTAAQTVADRDSKARTWAF